MMLRSTISCHVVQLISVKIKWSKLIRIYE